MKDRSNRRSQLCPQETFIISVALRQVSALSSRTEQELTKNFSARAAAEVWSTFGQLSGANLPLSLKLRRAAGCI